MKSSQFKSMGLFDFFKKADEDWHKLDKALIQAFGRIKRDTTLVFSWLRYLKEKDRVQDERHNSHKQQLETHRQHIVSHAQQLQKQGQNIQEHGSQLESQHTQLEKIKDEIFALKSEILQLKISRDSEKIPATAGSFPNLVRTKSEPKSEPAPRNYLEKTVLAKVRQQRKDYVIDQIVKLVNQGVRSTTEIESVIVGEKGMCGRTAFYDYMREMKHKKMLKRKDLGERKVIVTK
jgi:chromosome segregation ATPase